MGSGVRWRIRFASLVDSNDSELVPFALTEAWNARFQLLDGGHTVVVVGDEGVEPASEFVFLLNNVVATRKVLITRKDFFIFPPKKWYLMGLPPVSLGLDQRKVTDLLSKSTILGSPGGPGGPEMTMILSLLLDSKNVVT